jgi:selenide,water dikinase
LLPTITDPRIIVGSDTADDAAAFRLDEKTAIVQSVDYFTPIVDNAYDFGQIAAANSLSDIYAMGARPLFALNIVGFPVDKFPHFLLAEIIKGGVDKCAEADIVIAGGHTVKDDEPKYGLAVTGIVEPDRIVRNSTARPGDALILTKPLGTGIITTGIKADLASEELIEKVTHLMATLSRRASEVMVEVGPSACTDVTGFGLIGHLGEMIAASGVCARIRASDIPVMDEVWGLIRDECVPGGSEANRKQADECARWDENVEEPMRLALCDAQTSGGLLIAVPSETAERMLSALHEAGVNFATIIGAIEDGPSPCIFVDP